MLPWALAFVKEQVSTLGKNHPVSKCLPPGVPLSYTAGAPFKIVQTLDLVVVLYEYSNSFRQVFMDGRALPRDPQPMWAGYSVGRWDGDRLVVETAGFNDKTWLDGIGRPHTEALRVTERIHRRDFGHLEVQVTKATSTCVFRRRRLTLLCQIQCDGCPRVARSNPGPDRPSATRLRRRAR
jgi:hypothetical protein